MSTSVKTGDWLVILNEESKPREILVEVSTRCNLECIHCFRRSSRSLRTGDMVFEDFKKVVDNAVRSGVKKLVFTGWGEPTVNPDIVDMISYAKQNDLYVVLNTNGMILEEIMEDLLHVSLDEIYVSIDAVDVSLYESIRRLGDLSRVSQSIARMSELKKKRDLRKPVVKSVFTITKLNIEQVAKLIDYASSVGIQEVYLSFYIHYSTGVQGVDCVNDASCMARLREIMEGLTLKLLATNIRLWVPSTGSYAWRECPFAVNHAFFVRVDSKVAPCMFLAYSWDVVMEQAVRRVGEYLIGDALSESLVDIWRRNMKMLFKLSFNQMPSCLDCGLRNWCSYTLSTEFDCWGNTPNCSFCPYHYKFSYCPV